MISITGVEEYENLPEISEWTTDLPQIETQWQVLGGPDGAANVHAKVFANRTLWLKNNKADKAGNAAQEFEVKAASTPKAAVNKEQVEAMVAAGVVSATGFKNLIINGCLRVNQRGANAIDETASAYNFDRWYYDGTNFIQYIENKNIVLSGTYTLSWVGTATATVDGESVSNGGQVTLTANTQCEVKFNGSDFNFVQLEYGNKKTNFENRPYSVELALCQRYYESISWRYRIAVNYTTIVNTYSFLVSKRVEPTMAIYSTNSGASGVVYCTNPSGDRTAVVDPNELGGLNHFRVQHDNYGSNGGIHSAIVIADAEIYPV